MNIVYHFRVKGVGPERVHISGIAGGLQRLGHRLSFVSPTDVNPMESGDVAPARGPLRSILYFLADRMPQICFELMEILYNLVALSKLEKSSAAARVDLIYERYAFFCLAGTLFARRRGIPIVVEVNELSGFDRVRPQKLVRLAQAVERFIFSRADVVVTVSEFLKEQILERGGKGDAIIVVPNGIDTSLFTRRRDPESVREKHPLEGRTVIGFVGYLVHWHRLDLLLESFSRIREKRGDALLLLVGDGVLRGALERKARELGVAEHLVVTGRVEHAEVPGYLEVMDVAVIPHSNEYRSPIKMFEYMAAGKVVVAPDRQPILSIIEDGKTGVIFKNGDGEEMYRALEKVLGSESLRREIGARGKQLVFDRYTWDAHAVSILQAVERVAGAGAGAPNAAGSAGTAGTVGLR